jgi:hypothetical protein
MDPLHVQAVRDERIGRNASAWIHYTSAAQAAAANSDLKKEKFAQDRAARLAPTVDKLVIVPPDMPELEIERDGRIVPPSACLSFRRSLCSFIRFPSFLRSIATILRDTIATWRATINNAKVDMRKPVVVTGGHRTRHRNK